MPKRGHFEILVESDLSKRLHTLPEKGDEEEAMLSEAFYVKENSRLGCQISITEALDGLKITLAPED